MSDFKHRRNEMWCRELSHDTTYDFIKFLQSKLSYNSYFIDARNFTFKS
jgi:hypothetical protein